ncbi:SpoIIE family protein phosphatase [Klenkia sp. LSe6-5]|uniref:SpoIIE family protein phosphatase n=1 Tax=Klenkia sesuvii TaxID=3103137 RepID=A0ABU8DWJ4_9ACTN
MPHLRSDRPGPGAPSRLDLPAALGWLGVAGAQAPPDGVAEALAREWSARCGASAVRLWLVDHQHRWLRVPDDTYDRTEVAGASPVAHAFRMSQVLRSGTCVHVPLQLRGQRWGVLEVADAGPELDDDAWALVAATMVTALQAATGSSDHAERQRRSYDYSVAAERQWAVLPPLEQHHPPLRVTGLVEPAHVATSDLFDWSVDGDRLSACLVECAGSDVPATDTSLAVAAVRQARRTGQTLLEQVGCVDDVLARAGAAGHLRAVFLEADRGVGRVDLVLAGAPQLWTSTGDTREATRLRLPSGPLLGQADVRTTCTVELLPGAAVLAFSDGVLAAGVHEGRGLSADDVGRLVRAAGTAQDVPRTVLDEARRRGSPTGLPDDATCLVLSRDQAAGRPPSAARGGE